MDEKITHLKFKGNTNEVFLSFLLAGNVYNVFFNFFLSIIFLFFSLVNFYFLIKIPLLFTYFPKLFLIFLPAFHWTCAGRAVVIAIVQIG